MTWHNLLIRFGGYWNGLEYVGGEDEIVSIPDGANCLSYLMESVHDSVNADIEIWSYIVHSIIDVDGRGLHRKKIKNEYDVQCLLEEAGMPVVFVTLRKINCGSAPATGTQTGGAGTQTGGTETQTGATATQTGGNTSNTAGGFVQLMNSQSLYGGHNLGGVSSTSFPSYMVGSCNNPISTMPRVEPMRAHNFENCTDWGLGSGGYANLSDVGDGNGCSGDDACDDLVGQNNDVSIESEKDFDSEEDIQDQFYQEFSDWLSKRGGVLHITNNNNRTNRMEQRPHIVLNTETPDFNVNDSVNLGGPGWLIPGAPTSNSLSSDEPNTLFSNDSTLSVGSIYTTKDELILEVGKYHFENKCEYRVKYSDTQRYQVVCKYDSCPFILKANGRSSVWRVWELIRHACHFDPNRSAPRQLPSKIIGAYFAPKLLDENSSLVPKEMMNELRNKHCLNVRYGVALRAKHHAIGMIYGDEEKSFGMLPSYLHMVKSTNPGSVTALEVDTYNKFRYAFFALGQSIRGFCEHGRPVIVVDGTHLKGKYKGILFVAVTQDGNRQIFPLAVGVGDKEDNNSWTWFLENIKKAYGSPEDLLFVSDAHRSIGSAIQKVYPEAVHGLCCYHLQQKLKSFGQLVVSLFNKAAYSYRNVDYDRVMKYLETRQIPVYRRLIKVGQEKWARCKCPVRRYEFMNSNAAESFNKRVLWARRLPITSVLEVVRTVIERWFFERRTAALSREHELTEAAATTLGESVQAGATMEVNYLDNIRFKVKVGTKLFVVDLNARTCTCRQFDHLLMPCSHGAAAIRTVNHNIYSYVDECYKTTTLRLMWGGVVMPVPDPSEWVVPDEVKSIICVAPDNPRQAGRPRTNRFSAGSNRPRNTQVCSKCGSSGHNRVRCQEYSQPEESHPDQLPNTSGNARTRAKKKCGICRAPDHTRQRCPRRIDGALCEDDDDVL